MVSEINGTGSIKPYTGQAVTTDPAGKSPVPKASATSAPDNVTLTDLATRLQALTKSLEQLPEVDRQRVTEFAQMIADGAYQPDSSEIADKLAAFEQQLARNGLKG